MVMVTIGLGTARSSETVPEADFQEIAVMLLTIEMAKSWISSHLFCS